MKNTLKVLVMVFIMCILLADITIASKKENLNIQAIFNRMEIMINSEKVDMDNFIYNSTTYVPLRKITELFNKEIILDGPNKINIVDKNNRVNDFYKEHKNLNTAFFMENNDNLLELEFQLKNIGNKDTVITLSYPYYNIIIYDESESEIYNYSKECDFMTVIIDENIPTGESFMVKNKIDYKSINLNLDEIYKVVFYISFESEKDKYILSEKSYFRISEID